MLSDLIFFFDNKEFKIIETPLPKDDPLQRKPDITIAKNQLNWKPQVQLEEGLLKTIEYFRKINV